MSGLIAGATSWQVVYWVATALAAGLALVLSRVLPSDGVRPSVPYRTLLAATVRLFATEPLLRRRATFGALGFAAFSVFWTTVAFLLSGPPHHYSDSVIGLFGLIGAAGALCASFAGRLADRGLTRITTVAFCTAILVSFPLLWLGRTSVVWLAVGILVLDVGVQGLQVTNQSLIYTLAPNARSRVTSAYMVCYFTGGALGSAAAGATWDAGGWTAICWLGAGLGGVATVGSLVDRRSRSGVAGC
jgi:predicted MFS family arabinose efflux permease